MLYFSNSNILEFHLFHAFVKSYDCLSLYVSIWWVCHGASLWLWFPFVFCLMSLLVVWIACIVKCLVHIICVQISLLFCLFVFLSLTLYLWLSAWCTWCGMLVLRHTCRGQGAMSWSQFSPSGFIWSLGVEPKSTGLWRCVCFLRRLTHPGRNFVCNRFNCALIFYHWLTFYFSSHLSLSSLNLSVNL